MGDALSVPFIVVLPASKLRRSLARSRETRFTRPNRRACSQASCSYKAFELSESCGGSKETKPIKALFITGNLSP